MAKNEETNKAIENRYDFVYIFDVKDGNPNGDPDAGNQPRIDPETLQGLITDVSLKRKVRNYVTIAKKAEPPFEIYVKEKAILNDQQERAYTALKIDPKKVDKKDKNSKAQEARTWMCQNFYDIRTFGAVMNTGVDAGVQAGVVKGPIQFTFARSIDPIVQLEHSITRMAVATKKEAEDQGGENRTMGRKHTVPYALYQAQGFISAHFANDTGFSEEDLELFWSALQNMFDHDRSAARGEMAPRGLYIFKHESALGNAPAHKLFERITVKLKNSDEPPRAFSDYEVIVNRDGLPNGVELIEK